MDQVKINDLSKLIHVHKLLLPLPKLPLHRLHYALLHIFYIYMLSIIRLFLNLLYTIYICFFADPHIQKFIAAILEPIVYYFLQVITVLWLLKSTSHYVFDVINL